jgi:hypothetical protein
MSCEEFESLHDGGESQALTIGMKFPIRGVLEHPVGGRKAWRRWSSRRAVLAVLGVDMDQDGVYKARYTYAKV